MLVGNVISSNSAELNCACSRHSAGSEYGLQEALLHGWCISKSATKYISTFILKSNVDFDNKLCIVNRRWLHFLLYFMGKYSKYHGVETLLLQWIQLPVFNDDDDDDNNNNNNNNNNTIIIIIMMMMIMMMMVLMTMIVIAIVIVIVIVTVIVLTLII